MKQAVLYVKDHPRVIFCSVMTILAGVLIFVGSTTAPMPKMTRAEALKECGAGWGETWHERSGDVHIVHCNDGRTFIVSD